MPIVYDKLMAMEIEPAEQTYEAKDCMLYALGVGLGHDPMNEEELAFVYEKNLKVLPTMVTVIGHSGSLARTPTAASIGSWWSTGSRVLRFAGHSRGKTSCSAAPESSK